jgi:phosphoglucosamine mutase
MGKLFGTDGVRGRANTELSPLLALKLGTAAAHVIIETKRDAKVLIGRDPRISGDILEAALASGMLSVGVNVVLVGVVSTPGVAYLTNQIGAAAGAVISASHNPVEDNGIKFFGPDGHKLADEVEAEIERQIDGFDDIPRPLGKEVGRMVRKHELIYEYAAHVKSTSACRLEGMKLIIDCANGAASELGPEVFSELGAHVITTNCHPNGININENCGSLHPQGMAEAVKAMGADAGLSFDGDADRVIMADEKGTVVDGDHIMAIYALDRAAEGDLPGNQVVGTVMSNMGLEVALAEKGVKLLRTPVGDRNVWEEMNRTGAIVGGEKSGHIILSRHTSTGDGMITALQVLSLMKLKDKRLSELASQMQEFPQILVNVPVRERDGWDRVPEIVEKIQEAERRLEGQGRVLVRPSGTEKLIRVMAEGPDQQDLKLLTDRIVDAVKSKLG